jgi:hypothetical protein
MPVFADIDPVTHNGPCRCPSHDHAAHIGIIGLHLWGRGAPSMSCGNRRRAWFRRCLMRPMRCMLIQGQNDGNFGACEVLSFHATKFFNTFEGGAVVTTMTSL